MKVINFYFIGLFLLCGCSSFTKVQKQAEGLKQIKRVAIVGYSVSYEEPDSVLQRIAEKTKLNVNASGKVNGGENPEIDILYQSIASRLQSEMTWQVLTVSQLTSQATYKNLVKEYTTGMVTRPMVGKNSTVFRPTNILDAPAFAMMDNKAKAQLVKTLEVDAIVIVNVVSSLEEEGGLMKYVGASEFRPKAQVLIQVLDGRSEKPIWSDSWARGNGDKAVPSTLRFVDNKEMMAQVKIAVNHGYDDLFGRFKEQ